MVGQTSALRQNGPLRRLLEQDKSLALSSVLLWGPPGSGKTTLARLLNQAVDAEFVELSAISAGVPQVREVIAAAKSRRDLFDRPTVLFIDEIHRFNKAQQDALLGSVESGELTLVAATTENPSFSVIRPLISRSLVIELAPLESDEILQLLDRALSDPRGLPGRTASAEGLARIATLASGDARRALTILEAAAAVSPGSEIAKEHVAEVTAQAIPYDADGDLHYDTISAFIKSVRGSDVDAALHYLARMIAGGEDPRFIARRLIILAAEDIGLADPQALPLAVAAAEAVALIGMPEGRIPLAEVTVYLALAPKSNAAYKAINAALEDVEANGVNPVPAQLRSTGGVGYLYPHDYPSAIVAQHYGVDAHYFQPSSNGFEARLAERLISIREILKRSDDANR